MEQHSFPFNIPAVRFAKGVGVEQAVTIFVGDNGTGKSTLLENMAYAIDIPLIGDRRGFGKLRGGEGHSAIHEDRLETRGTQGIFFPRGGFQPFCRQPRQGKGEDRDGADRSGGKGGRHGDRADEREYALGGKRDAQPEAALSPLKQLSLMALILEVLKAVKAQFIIATHSPILMGIPDAVNCQIHEEGLERVAYEETDHYRIAKRFLDAPESYLRHLR